IPALSGLTGLAAVRARGKDGRDLVFAGEKGLVVAVSRDGYRAGPPIGAAAHHLQVADIGNSGALDLVTPGAFWTPGKEGYRRTELAGGERVLPFDYDSDGDLDLFLSGKTGDRLLRNNLD